MNSHLLPEKAKNTLQNCPDGTQPSRILNSLEYEGYLGYLGMGMLRRGKLFSATTNVAQYSGAAPIWYSVYCAPRQFKCKHAAGDREISSIVYVPVALVSIFSAPYSPGKRRLLFPIDYPIQHWFK